MNGYEYELTKLGIDDSRDEIIDYCMMYGPRRLLLSMVETRRDIVNICELLDVSYERQDDKIILAERIAARILNADFPYNIHRMNFTSLLRFIEDTRRAGRSSYESEAFKCVKMLEEIVGDIYNLFVIRILYEFLEGDELGRAKRTIITGHAMLGDTIGQVRGIDSRVREGKGKYQQARDKIREITGEISILEPIDKDKLKMISSIRGEYFAHGNHSDDLVSEKSGEIIDLIKDVCVVCTSIMPKIIFPVHLGINEWGVKYISYLEEDDLDSKGYLRSDCHKLKDGKVLPEHCRRYFLLETPIDFRAYESAFYLKKSKSQFLCDPTIIYLSDLERTREKLQKELEDEQQRKKSEKS